MEDRWDSIERKIKSWMKRNKPLMTVSVLIGFLLTPFLWPFFLAIIYTALSLAVPVFLILLGIKMPWGRTQAQGSEEKTEAGQEEMRPEEQKGNPKVNQKEKENVYEQRKDAFSQREDSQDGEVPEPGQEEKNGSGRGQERNKEREAALCWYRREGKSRILNLMKKAEGEGAVGISIRKDGSCSAKKAGRYYRIGALRSFPGDDMQLIAKWLGEDIPVPFVKVKGRYLCIFWNNGKREEYV